MNRRDFIYAASAGAAASATMPAMTLAQGNREIASEAPRAGAKLRTITLEEHFASPGWFAGPGRGFAERLRNSGPRGVKIIEQLQDVGEGRIVEMDAGGIDVQVLSLNSPGVEQADVAEQIEIAHESNDFLVDVVKKIRNGLRRLRPYRSQLLSKRPMNSIAGSGSRASRARSSMAIRAAAIWMTNSSGRSWSAPKPSMSRSIFIRAG
jgi:hypothetical protein